MSLNPYGLLAAAVGAFAAGWYVHSVNKPPEPHLPAANSVLPPSSTPDRSVHEQNKYEQQQQQRIRNQSIARSNNDNNEDAPYFEAPLTTHPSFPRPVRRTGNAGTEEVRSSFRRDTVSGTDDGTSTPEQYLRDRRISLDNTSTTEPYPGAPSELGITGPDRISNIPHRRGSNHYSSHIPPYDHSHPWFDVEEENIAFEDAQA